MTELLDALTGTLGLFIHKGAVQKIQRLRWQRGLDSATGHDIRVGHVECLEHIHHRVPEKRHVDTPSNGVEFVTPVVLRELADRVAALLIAELATNRENRIPNGLRGEPLAVGTPEQPVFRIRRQTVTLTHRGEPIGSGEDDVSDHLLHRPVVASELTREPVQQLGMAWSLAHHAKIVRSTYQPLPH